jgi:hypothetical protein
MPENTTDLICIPESGGHRFVLGYKGENNLLVIALNPNTAAGNKHDSTTRNIERFAKEHDYDGWVLFNLSPVRDPNPKNLLDEHDEVLQQENFKQFCKVVDDKTWDINNVWLAWGNGVTGRKYLITAAIQMLDYLEPKNLNYFCIKRTNQNHPYHSAQRVLNSFFKKGEKIKFETFPAQAYKELILKYSQNE